MKDTEEKLSSVDWERVTEEMNAKGYAIIPDVIPDEQCEQLVNNYSSTAQCRKTITMERYRFGSGGYKYFKYPLPDLPQSIREEVYSLLARRTPNPPDRTGR